MGAAPKNDRTEQAPFLLNYLFEVLLFFKICFCFGTFQCYNFLSKTHYKSLKILPNLYPHMGMEGWKYTL